MKLLTKDLIQRFKQVGSQTNNENPTIIAKFHFSLFYGHYYAIGYDAHKQAFYGYYINQEDNQYKACYFNENQLEIQLLSLDLSAERDYNFKEMPLSLLLKSLSF